MRVFVFKLNLVSVWKKGKEWTPPENYDFFPEQLIKPKTQTLIKVKRFIKFHRSEGFCFIASRYIPNFQFVGNKKVTFVFL
jgi:hypothetical protein